MAKDDALRERALANFELLLEFWKIEYKKITEAEYDLLAFWRKDKNFGSCRFNTEKGRGADFADSSFTREDFRLFGEGFDSNDFSGFSEAGQAKTGFDIIGLCQRVYRCNTYNDAVRYLKDDLRSLAHEEGFTNPSEEAIKERLRKQEELKAKKQNWARDLWESSKYHIWAGSPGEKYLQSRGIYVRDKNIRFHPSIVYGPSKLNFPALLFKVQELPEGEIKGVHRIYLTTEGKKANVENPKAILGALKGNAIWFGTPGRKLYIAEGPENALTCIEKGASFACSAISSGNLQNIHIPHYVNNIIIAPDPDPVGLNAIQKFVDSKRDGCTGTSLKIRLMHIPMVPKDNGKFKDLNDLHMESI